MTHQAEVMQMSLGEKAQLDITSDFAYGRQGAGGVIPPNSDLVFEARGHKGGETGCFFVVFAKGGRNWKS